MKKNEKNRESETDKAGFIKFVFISIDRLRMLLCYRCHFNQMQIKIKPSHEFESSSYFQKWKKKIRILINAT